VIREGNIARRRRVATAVAVAFVLSGHAFVVGAQEPELPITVIRGERPGPTIAFVTGVHGGKVSAVRALESLARTLRPGSLCGTVLLVGPANVAGFHAGLSQTSPDDGLNLNRVFPGRSDGRPTERLAARIMRDVVARSDYLVDMHGSDGDEAVGRFAYVARPGIDPKVDSAALVLARLWGTPLVVWDETGPRSLAESRFLQTAAHLAGVPAMTIFEEGDRRYDPAAVEAFETRVRSLLLGLEMLMVTVTNTHAPQLSGSAEASCQPFPWRTSPRVLAAREVVAAVTAGRWFPAVRPGQEFRRGELLGVLRGSSGSADSLRAGSSGIVLHQRLPGIVTATVPLVIFGVVPDPVAPSLRAP